MSASDALVTASATEILIQLLGAVALLLWGTRMVRTGILRVFGADLRHLLRVSLRNRFAAFLAGIGVTCVLQSSTATTLLMAAFAGRGVVETAPALAVMLGADFGSTLVAQVLSFNLHWLAPVLILAGVITHNSAERSSYHGLGRVAIGLGLMLLALRLILLASAPMREAPILQELFGALAPEALILILIAGLLTWLAHSSLAIVLLIMSLASVGVLPLTSACALVLGANLGAAMPAITATFADKPAARRVALGNLIFRLTGCIVALPFVAMIVPWLQQLEPAPGRVVVNFHTAFNLALGLAFILLTDVVARLCARLLPDLPVEADPERPRHLDRTTLESPSLALACAAREALRMGDLIETMLRDSFDVFRSNDRQKLTALQRMEHSVDKLHEAIKLFVTDVSREPLNPGESRRSAEILAFTTNLEHIGDIIDKSLLELAEKKTRLQLRFSSEGWTEIEALHAHVLDNLRMALGVFVSGDVAIARKLIDEKVAVRDAERQAAENHLARLRAGRPESIDSSALHLDILRDLKRIHSHICAVAYPLLDEAGQLYRSRLKRVERRAMQDEETSERRASAGPPDEPAPPPSAGLGRAQDSEAEESGLAAPPRERTVAR
ncbi:MAG: Na/Pi cotransporter [Geminicoccaceae bacterium]|jgi:phosphate:Na+ symporter|nr:Na/Pi cotransporter [Geminicoccaceae bacterium]MDF2780899.1 Na/Pi cotransporter [Geminicoccaceae bacterium]